MKEHKQAAGYHQKSKRAQRRSPAQRRRALPIREVARRAAAAGMSYGRYVAKYAL